MTGPTGDPGGDPAAGELATGSLNSTSTTTDSRRLSLGSLMGKGLVTGMRGLWEQPGGAKPGAMGRSSYTRAKFSAVSQSQDRGLLFKLSEDKTEPEACPEHGPIRAARGSSPPARSNSQPGNSPILARNSTPPSDKKTPQSALKKMWKSMTQRSSKHQQEQGSEDTNSAGRDLDVSASTQLPSIATLVASGEAQPHRLFSAMVNDVCPADDQCAVADAHSTPVSEKPDSTAFNSPEPDMGAADNSLQGADDDIDAEQHEMESSRSVSAPLDSPMMRLGCSKACSPSQQEQQRDSMDAVQLKGFQPLQLQEEQQQVYVPASSMAKDEAAEALYAPQGQQLPADHQAPVVGSNTMTELPHVQVADHVAPNTSAAASPSAAPADVTVADVDAEARCEQWFQQIPLEEQQAAARPHSSSGSEQPDAQDAPTGQGSRGHVGTQVNGQGLDAAGSKGVEVQQEAVMEAAEPAQGQEHVPAQDGHVDCLAQQRASGAGDADADTLAEQGICKGAVPSIEAAAAGTDEYAGDSMELQSTVVGAPQDPHKDSAEAFNNQASGNDVMGCDDGDGMEVDEPAIVPTDNDAAFFWPADTATTAPAETASGVSADNIAVGGAATVQDATTTPVPTPAVAVSQPSCDDEVAQAEQAITAATATTTAASLESKADGHLPSSPNMPSTEETAAPTSIEGPAALLAEHSLATLAEEQQQKQHGGTNVVSAGNKWGMQPVSDAVENHTSTGFKADAAVVETTAADVGTASLEYMGMDWDVEMLSPPKPSHPPAAAQVTAPASITQDGAEADLLGLGTEAAAAPQPSKVASAPAVVEAGAAAAGAAVATQAAQQGSEEGWRTRPAPVVETARAAITTAATTTGTTKATTTAAHGGLAARLPPLVIAEPVVPEPHSTSPQGSQLHAQLSPCGMMMDSPIPMAVSPVPADRKFKSIAKDCNPRPNRFMPSVSIGTDALVSDLMAALQDVNEADLQHIRDAARTAPHSSVTVAAVKSSAAVSDAARADLGLIDMDMEDVTGNLVDVAAMHASAGQHSHADDDHSASPRVKIQDVRASIPLFANSMMVTDSVSLERQSLASIEPYAKAGSHTPAAALAAAAAHPHGSMASARPAGLMASMLTLDTLQEDECFTASDVPTPTNTRTVAAAKARAKHLDEQLPHNEQLGDPEVLKMGMPAGSQHMPHTPAAIGLQAIEEQHSLARQAGHMQGPVSGFSHDIMDSPAAGVMMATPGHGKQPGPDAASMSLKGAAKTPASHARRLAGPGSMKHTAPASTNMKAAVASTTGKAAPTTTPLTGGMRRAPATKATPHSHNTGATQPTQKAAPSMQRTPTMKQAAGVQQMAAMLSTPVTRGVAVAPPMPDSWDTPLAQMQQLPFDLALNAPLLDGSPFPDFDNMDTMNIAEEASRLANLALGGDQHQGHSAEGMPASLMLTPHATSTGTQGKGTPTLVPGRPSGHGPPSGTAARAMHGPGKSPTPGLMSLSPAAAGFLEAQNAQLLERLLAAEQRAAASEQEAEQLRDQIKTMNFGDLMQGASSMDASDMEREARLCAEEQLQAANTQMARLQESVHGLQGALQEEQARVKAAQTSAAHMAQELNSMTAELQACKMQLDTANAKVSQLEAQCHGRQQQVATLHSELEGTKQQLVAAERDVARVRQARDEALGSLKRSADELIAEQLKRQQQVRESNAQQSALHSSLNNYQADKERLRKELHEAQVAMKALQDKYKMEIGKLTDEREQLLKMANELLVGLEQERAKAASKQ